MTSFRKKKDIGYIVFDDEDPSKYYVNPFPRSSRGRGKNLGDGVPLLPIGLWDSLYHGIDKTENDSSNAVETAEINDDDEIINEVGDWKCSNCENVNWSWRPKCNKCNHEKPLHLMMKHRKKSGDIANLNENLAQDRASSSVIEVAEDGFDDFGRRIKKNKVDKKAKEEAALARLNSSYATVINPLAALELLRNSNASNNNNNNNNNIKNTGQFDNAESNIPRKSNVDIKHDYSKDRNRDNSRDRDRRRGNSRDRNWDNSRDRDRRRGNSRDRNRGNSRDRDRRR